MNKQLIILTEEKLLDIYTNERFRNDVASAHACTKNGNLVHKKTCSFPIEYIVTDEQINKAKAELQRAREQAEIDHAGKLVFIGMGMQFESSERMGDIGNYRVRASFTNARGRKHFIEVGQWLIDRQPGNAKMRCDHSQDVTREEELNRDHRRQGEYYNFAHLERSGTLGEYTRENLLALVNENFACLFTEIIIDNHTLTPDHQSISPLY